MTVRWQGEQVEARIRQMVMQTLLAVGNDVRNVAIKSMTGKKTGRIYRRRTVSHQASAPGQAPAVDTGRLRGSIDVDTSRISALVVTIRAQTEYAEHLEFGTSRMAARPYMRPALAKATKSLDRDIARAIKRAV